MKKVKPSQISAPHVPSSCSASHMPASNHDETRYSNHIEPINIERVYHLSAAIPATIMATIPVKNAPQKPKWP